MNATSSVHQPSQTELDAGLRFGFLIHDVSRLRRVVIDRALKPLGITRSQWWVLAFLSRAKGEGITQTALAGELDLTKVAIGGLLDRMETAGFVTRRADPNDRRARRVLLTKAGTQLISRIRRQVEDVELDILRKVGTADLDQASETLLLLKATLIEMIGNSDADDPEGEP